MIARNKYHILHVVIVVFFMFAFGNLMGSVGNITELGMQVIGIFIGLLYGWTFSSFLWPSLLSFLAIGLTDVMTVNEALAAGFGANLTLTLIFIFIFAKYLEDSKLNQKLAYWFVSRKVAIGRPWILAFFILFCALLLGMVTNLFAVIVVCWSVFYEICDLFVLPKKCKFVAVMLFGICVAATFGSMAVPFQAVPLASIGVYEEMVGESVQFIPYTIFCMSMSLILIILYLLLARFVFRADASALAKKDDLFSRFRDQKVTIDTKISAFF